ncbi:GNAT family N-acetyltransferase [Streptomyces sp. TRM66268-LWL]|uniref:GNAT family N-acetyltransferase n=1 Tax=Streptomyces polyasparticus TaxID=2767826 RepID=A0ABR7SE63_9ACTN|nr:GNAT family N-acetyltransferase [Streptomyces polyasparticus]MBC9712643.1 GNAT family N-acetyltransferase [Streptomyces polyasparticus]
MTSPRLPTQWPLAGLRLTTPRLELRLPGPDELSALASLAAEGVHDPAVQPFTVPWTDAEPGQRARDVLQYHWRCWGEWQPQNWVLNLVVLYEGAVVGMQGVSARDFAVCREVSTGSWLGLRHHGRGMGTEMRTAVLHLAFAGLGARHALSGALHHNAASLAVSRKLGYRDDGIEHHAVRGEPALMHRLRLTAEQWQYQEHIPVKLDGLTECLPLFGLDRV